MSVLALAPAPWLDERTLAAVVTALVGDSETRDLMEAVYAAADYVKRMESEGSMRQQRTANEIHDLAVDALRACLEEAPGIPGGSR